MLRTLLCDLLGIEIPIIQAGMSVLSSAELVAAVSNAGGLGSLGAWRRPPENLSQQLSLIRELTDKPFAVNFVVPEINEDSLNLALQAKPAVMSFALDDPGENVRRAHDVGSLVVHQVTTVEQAYQAAERGVDVIIAQGSESGGFGGSVATLPLVPQVVDAVGPVPVVAAGGIADGRSLAAVLLLGAVGANVGTRFLASLESPISDDWKTMIVQAKSEDAIKFEALNTISPMPGTRGYGTVVRALRTEFIDTWSDQIEEAGKQADELSGQLMAASQAGRLHELLPAAGESAGLIKGVASAGEIVETMSEVAEQVLGQASKFVR
ncbi:MAG: nitronate monooxygenase [Chloroflexi bacterium]|nr:nitronate monooxygenase [Chloroflexota bacterium]